MKAIAIMQTRMGSTRLPGKVLMDIAGRTMLARCVERTRLVPGIREVVVATTVDPRDAPVVKEAARLGAPVFRGSEQDVLDRYYRAAEAFKADPVVRVTSDSPLLDPEVGGLVLKAYREEDPDYASNSVQRTFPLGLNLEAIRPAALARAWREARKTYERVHVTPYIYQHPELFRLVHVRGERDLSDHRWTVDSPEDLAFVRAVYERLGADGRFGWREVLDLVNHEPQIREINRRVRQKALDEG